MVERVSNILLVTKMTKNLDLYVYCFYRWVDIEEILMKLNMSSLRKDNELLEKYNEKFQGKSQQ